MIAITTGYLGVDIGLVILAAFLSYFIITGGDE